MAVKPILKLLINLVCGIPRRARLYQITGDIEPDVTVRPVDLPDRMGRYQDVLAKPPNRCIDGEIADNPVHAVDEEVLDISDAPISGMDMVARHLGDAAQMRVSATGAASLSRNL